MKNKINWNIFTALMFSGFGYATSFRILSDIFISLPELSKMEYNYFTVGFVAMATIGSGFVGLFVYKLFVDIVYKLKNLKSK